MLSFSDALAPGFALPPFAMFCLVATGTPGPNNMINLAQGVRLGFWRALPFAIGTGVGIASLLVGVALGLGAVMAAAPVVEIGMRAATVVFLLYLAWKMATAGPLQAQDDGRRLGFLAGVGFQWINPKTWATTMTMAATFLPPTPSIETALTAGALFCAIGWTTQPLWIGFGATLRGLLAAPGPARLFNGAMAALLLATTLPLLLAGPD